MGAEATMIKTIMIPSIAALTFIVGVFWLLTIAWSGPLTGIQSAVADNQALHAAPAHPEAEALARHKVNCFLDFDRSENRPCPIRFVGTSTNEAAAP
jgi:hypothetical protein